MDLEAALSHLKQEPFIKNVIEETETPDFNPSGKVYYDLLISIVSQQLSGKAATTIFNRFCALFPDNYPHPEQLISLEKTQLRGAGLSNQKAAYLQNIAVFALETDLEDHPWNTLSDQEIIVLLTKIKGVGLWTAQMILMFTLDRPDVLPLDDLGIQQAMAQLFSVQETGKNLKNKMMEYAEPWQPYRTVACRYLWRWKDAKNQANAEKRLREKPS